MKVIRIKHDYLQVPIWTSDPATGRPENGIEAVDNDEALRRVNYKIQVLYGPYYEFDSHGQACWFNEGQEKADRDKMLGLLARLCNRLEELDDGSYEIEDLETPRYLQM